MRMTDGEWPRLPSQYGAFNSDSPLAPSEMFLTDIHASRVRVPVIRHQLASRDAFSPNGSERVQKNDELQ